MLINLLKNEISEEEFIRENSIKIIYKKLPKKVYGFIHKYRDLNIIIINDYISENKKKLTLLHEFAHLELNHLEKNLLHFRLENIEDDADKYVKNILNIINFE